MNRFMDSALAVVLAAFVVLSPAMLYRGCTYYNRYREQVKAERELARKEAFEAEMARLDAHITSLEELRLRRERIFHKFYSDLELIGSDAYASMCSKAELDQMLRESESKFYAAMKPTFANDPEGWEKFCESMPEL